MADGSLGSRENDRQATTEEDELTVSAQAEKDHVHLSVTHTGCGIRQEDMRGILEPQFAAKARGIGLRMTVSRYLVERNEGGSEAGSVESKEGKGSTFTVVVATREVA